MSKTSNYSVEDSSKPERPLPNDFENFVSWAMTQLATDISLVITRVTQDEYVSAQASARSKGRGRVKSKIIKDSMLAGDIKDESNELQQSQESEPEDAVLLQTTYDTADNLVNMKIESHCTIPRVLIKLIVRIIKFYPHLTAITINRGLSMALVHEMQALLSTSSITDVCLDNTFVKQANYHILLQTEGNLKQLSLARCTIDDTTIMNIAMSLKYPEKASKTLHLLNLSSNKITDLGARYLAEALKTNRKLSYLNLSGNMISDDGASSIFDVFIEFMLTDEDILAYKSRRLTYLKEKNAIIRDIIKQLKANDMENKMGKKKFTKITPASPKTKGVTKELSAKGLFDGKHKTIEIADSVWEQKANQMAEAMMEPFNDPFSGNIVKDDLTYCLGNNTLCYLNLSYNNISYLSLKKIFNVLTIQKNYDRKPTGLIKLCIEGNPMPHSCKELVMLSQLLDSGLMNFSRRLSIPNRKKLQSRNTLK